MQTDPISAAHAYRQALQAVMKAAVLHQARQAAQQALEITFTPPEAGMVHISSGYGGNTRQPFVEFGLANPTESANPTIQISTQQARALALQILEVADAAESDGFIVSWLGGVAQLDERQAAAVLNDFRAYRERARGAKGEPE